MILILSIILSCDNSEDSKTAENQFSNPQKVTILGYDNAGDNAMEPFITRDGAYLIFNSDQSDNNKDIYIAGYVDGITFQLISKLGNVNSTGVDGTPSTDISGNFYCISTKNYDNVSSFDTIYTGTLDSVNNKIDNIAVVDGLADDVPYHVNFDVEINPAGTKMYFVDGEYDTSWNPIQADIKTAAKSGSNFTVDADSDFIMMNINTSDLEYAPCISSDGLELFFNRASAGDVRIYRSTRSSSSSQFSIPAAVTPISEFVEGPCLSPDEKSLYYHKKEGSRFVIYRMTR